jgi:hypothetical protein
VEPFIIRDSPTEALGHSFGMCFLTLAQKDISFSSYHLKDKYVELMYRKECNSSQVYCHTKGCFQKSQEFSNDMEKGF